MTSRSAPSVPPPSARAGLAPSVRALRLDELVLAVDIDVTEDGEVVLEQHGREIRSRPESWHRPPRSAARWAEFEATWRGFVPANGAAFGAFARPTDRESERLIGIATLRRGVRPSVDQLEALFVDRGHRREGVAAALVEEVERAARSGGARTLYVSATPSESAVGFYLSRGFRPTDDPIPELLEREPDDVHMVLDLGTPPRR